MSTTLVELIAAGIFLVCILDGVHKGLLLKVFSLLRMVVVLALTMILVPVLKPLFAANSEVQKRCGVCNCASCGSDCGGNCSPCAEISRPHTGAENRKSAGRCHFRCLYRNCFNLGFAGSDRSVSGCNVVQGDFGVRKTE